MPRMYSLFRPDTWKEKNIGPIYAIHRRCDGYRRKRACQRSLWNARKNVLNLFSASDLNLSNYNDFAQSNVTIILAWHFWCIYSKTYLSKKNNCIISVRSAHRSLCNLHSLWPDIRRARQTLTSSHSVSYKSHVSFLVATSPFSSANLGLPL